MQYNGGDPSEEWVIAESDHYIIKGCFEDASIYKKDDNSYLTCVGDFYGDPLDGIIDKNERFCVVVGCGYIIYYLKEPFEEYMYDKNTSQWIEAGRGPENILSIHSVSQISDSEIEIEMANGEKRIIRVPMDNIE